MAYDQQLAERIRQYFSSCNNIVEKNMFGGLAFMLDGHMCVGTTNSRFVARVGPRHYERALQEMYTSIIDFTGKPLKGFVYVEPEAISTDPALYKWIRHCEKFVRSLPPK
jgi:TfoX/Sxy family transcriptional regulator of competence genes